MFESDEQIDDFLQSRNEFASTKQSLRLEIDDFTENETPKIDFSSNADIKLIKNPYDVEIFDNLDQRELEVLQCKDDTLPRGLTPLEELFDFNDVA